MTAVSEMTYQRRAVGDEKALPDAIDILARGGVVVVPTETRYGILVKADIESAVNRLFELKGRNTTNPTAIFVGDAATIGRLGMVTPVAEGLIESCLPGPLTLVLKARVDWGAPRVVNGMIGFRWSSSELIQRLVTEVGSPLTATSANLSGLPDHESISDIIADFGDGVDLYLDGGMLTGPVSTVVECAENSYRILRDGAIGRQKIAEIAGRG